MLFFSWALLPLFGAVWVESAAVPGAADAQVHEHPALSRRVLPKFEDFTGQASEDKIQTGFKDMTTIIRTALKADIDDWLRVLDHWFDLGDEDDCDTPSTVSTAVWDMLSNMAISQGHGEGTEYGSEMIGDIKITATDFASRDKDVSAYMSAKGNRNGPQLSRMHITPAGLSYPSLAETECGKLGNEVSWDMRSLGYIIIHELTHSPHIASNVIPRFSQCNGHGPMTRDIQMNGAVASGPAWAHILRLSIVNGKMAVCNAENYAWFATELYWTVKCKKSFTAPTKGDRIKNGLAPQ